MECLQRKPQKKKSGAAEHAKVAVAAQQLQQSTREQRSQKVEASQLRSHQRLLWSLAELKSGYGAFLKAGKGGCEPSLEALCEGAKWGEGCLAGQKPPLALAKEQLAAVEREKPKAAQKQFKKKASLAIAA